MRFGFFVKPSSIYCFLNFTRKVCQGCAPVMIVCLLNLYSPLHFLTSVKSCLCRFWQKLTETDRSWQKDADFDREAICFYLRKLIILAYKAVQKRFRVVPDLADGQEIRDGNKGISVSWRNLLPFPLTQRGYDEKTIFLDRYNRQHNSAHRVMFKQWFEHHGNHHCHSRMYC